MNLLVCLVFLCLLVYQSTNTRATSPRQPLPYTTIQFVQSWGPGYCKGLNSNCKPNLEDKFYTHGLWPADSNGESLKNCKGQSKILDGNGIRSKFSDSNEVAAVEKHWKSITQSFKDNLEFWAHEWQKHGICSERTIPDPKTYLQRGADITENINLLDFLMKKKILPGGQPYSKDEIQEAIRNGLGISLTIYITCSRRDSNIYLKEIYLCMDVHAKKFISCPTKADDRSCGTSPQTRIELPKF